MQKPFNEIILGTSPLGIKTAFYTRGGGYTPPHWHDALEIFFSLNGEHNIFVDEKMHPVRNRQFIVIESGKIHSTYLAGEQGMLLCIHVTKKALEWYLPKIQDEYIRCFPDELSEKEQAHYSSACTLLEKISRLYISDSPTFLLETDGLVLQILSDLILHFSSSRTADLPAADKMTLERIRRVITYVEEHYKEPLSLQDAAGLLGLGREYFCRFFKKHMGISFLQYVNEVRTSHIYEDLIHTDEPVHALTEKHGFYNQKLFNRTFKNLYGCTPSAVRK